MRIFTYKLLLIFSTVEGVITFGLLLSTPSEVKSAVFLGYSIRKILVLGSTLLFDLVLALITIRVIQNENRLERKINSIKKILESGENLFYTSMVLLLGIIGLCGLLVIGKVTTGRTSYAINHLWYPIVWFTAMLVQIAFLLGYQYGKKFVQDNKAGKLFLIFVLLITNIFQWIVLIFNLNFYTKIFNRFWNLKPVKHFSSSDLLILAIIAGSCFLAFYLLHTSEKTWRQLILVFVWGLFLQIGFGFIERTGLKEILQNYTNTSHVIFIEKAAENPGLLNVILDYEQLYGQSSDFTGTKPPGVMAFYVAVEKISNFLSPQGTAAARLDKLENFIVLVFPVVSFLVVFPLYALGNRLGKKQDAILSSLFYLCFPNVLLITLFVDQVLYPLVFTSCILLLILVIEKRSFWLATMTGLILYTALFLSFSLIPLVFLAFLMVGLHFLFFRNEDSHQTTSRALIEYALLVIGLFLGLIISYFLYKTILNYDILNRFAQAMKIQSRIFGDVSSGFSILSTNALRAIADFSFWTGYTSIVLLIVSVAVSIKKLIRKEANRIDWMTLSFFITFLLLVISGSSGPETGRLWIFITPLLALLSVNQVVKLFPQRKHGVFLFIILQLITTYIIFHYHDFS